MTQSAQTYSKPAIALHWLMAIIILGLLAVGFIMGEFDAPLKYEIYGLHKAFGIIALALVIIRFVWRQVKSPPPLPETTPLWQKLASHTTHIALYGAMIAMPLFGWIMSSAGGHPVSVFGIPIPAIVEENKELGKWANEMHELFAWVLIGMISLHLGAALFHHFVQKDGVLHRMLPCKKCEKSA